MDDPFRHEYRALDDQEKQAATAIKDRGVEFNQLIDSLGYCREYSLAKTKMEEAVMWAIKGLTLPPQATPTES